MARPERNNVDYFPFLCEEGEKMFYLEQTYGNDGFATFVKILRELARKDYHHINLIDQSSRMFLAAKCRISIELLESIITDLVMLGKFDKKLWDSKIIWCQDFIDNIQDAYKKRNNNCITYNGLVDRLNSLGVLKQSKSAPKEPLKPHSIEEDIIEEESKTPFDKVFNDFIEMRKKIKAPLTEMAKNLVLNKLRSIAGQDESMKIKMLENSIMNSWKSVYSLDNEKWNLKAQRKKLEVDQNPKQESDNNLIIGG